MLKQLCLSEKDFECGDKPGVLVITFRNFSEAITQGKGEKDALWQAADCLEEAIDAQSRHTSQIGASRLNGRHQVSAGRPFARLL
jgi:hypothetical protein